VRDGVRVDGVLQPLLFGGAQNAVELLGLPRPSIVVGPHLRLLLPSASRRRRDRRLQQSSLLLLKTTMNDNDNNNDGDDNSASSVSVFVGWWAVRGWADVPASPADVWRCRA
jgi:hypothetical protein